MASPQSNLEFGDGAEVARLPPRSDDLLDLDEKAKGRGRQLALAMLEPLNSGDPICMPVDVAAGSPARNGSVETPFSARETDAVTAACRARNLSVTAAWHTAVALATRAIQRAGTPGGAAGNKFMGYANFSLRGYFPQSADKDAYTVTNHHTVLPTAVETEGRSFAEIAAELAAFYRRGISEPAEVWSARKQIFLSLLFSFCSLFSLIVFFFFFLIIRKRKKERNNC